MRVVNYFKESYAELVHKVSWPTFRELQNSAIVVMVASLLFAGVIVLMDLVFSRLMTFIYAFLYN